PPSVDLPASPPAEARDRSVKFNLMHRRQASPIAAPAGPVSASWQDNVPQPLLLWNHRALPSLMMSGSRLGHRGESHVRRSRDIEAEASRADAEGDRGGEGAGRRTA